MVSTIVYQLTRNLTQEQLRAGGYSAYFVNHTNSVYPCDANGTPFSAATLQVTGDPIADVHEDLAAEQKARSTYDNILRMTDDPDVLDAIRFLRAREVVHYQRFGEGLRIITDNLDDRNFYAFNPAFDTAAVKKSTAQPAESKTEQDASPAQKQPPLMAVQTERGAPAGSAEGQGSFCNIPKTK